MENSKIQMRHFEKYERSSQPCIYESGELMMLEPLELH